MLTLLPSVADERDVPKARTEEVSVKLSNLPSDNSSGRQTHCLNTQTEGATAKVITSCKHNFCHFLKLLRFILFSLLLNAYTPVFDNPNMNARICVSSPQPRGGRPRSSTC